MKRTPLPADPRRAELLELVLRTFERRRIVLSSGKQSDFYLDLRKTLMLPRGVLLAGELVLERLLAGPTVEALGGMAVGAVPLVAAVLAAAARRDPETRLVGFFVRKETKAHGLGRRIEGGFAAGQTVALVEDTATTGGSLLEAVEAVEAAGGKVARVLCVVDRGEGAAQAFAARGLPLESLFTRADLPIRSEAAEDPE
jgi:orotate phosphoribosyltransferase